MTKILKKILLNSIRNLFELDKYDFKKIIIKKEVIEDIIDFAKANHPKEFVAFFNGMIKNKELTIKNLVYNEYLSNESSAIPIFHFPDKSFYGSVHSHPSGSNKPSAADRHFFSKIGIVNAIISYPYTIETIKFYNHEGIEIEVIIK
ncbi:MAG: hypothetical protein KatS3mg002_0918 [Candidatus Woesearchaeota archaeon]|nr:MAG: hypothetical protein KatS3mg002_0918 [Candidatus Woesearchaeota archaeon]